MALLFIATVQVNGKSLYSVPSSSHGAAPHLSNISDVHGFPPLNNPTICDQNFGKMQYTVRPDITSLAIKSFGRYSSCAGNMDPGASCAESMDPRPQVGGPRPTTPFKEHDVNMWTLRGWATTPRSRRSRRPHHRSPSTRPTSRDRLVRPMHHLRPGPRHRWRVRTLFGPTPLVPAPHDSVFCDCRSRPRRCTGSCSSVQLPRPSTRREGRMRDPPVTTHISGLGYGQFRSMCGSISAA